MSEHLFIRFLPGNSDQVNWLATDASGRRIGLVKAGSLAEAAEKAGQRKVVLLVPGTEIVHTRVKIPLKGGSKLRQAVPFALEDQIADDVENMHFAIGKRDENDAFPVAVTQKSNMLDWHARLDEAGLKAQVIVSDSSCVPETPGGYTLIVDGEITYVCGPDDLNLVLENMTLDQALEFAGVHIGDEQTASLPVNLYLGRQDHDENAELIEFLGGQLSGLNPRVMVDGCLAHLASGMFAREPVNLRQGDFAPRTSPERLWKPWRLAAGLAAAVLFVAVGGQVLQLYMLNKQEAALDTEIQDSFKKVFPNVTLRGDPARQMRSELAALRTAAGNIDPLFLEALVALSESASGKWNGNVDSISFRNGVLDLKILVPSVEILDQIRQNMEQAGKFEVELESANPSGNQVEGRIQMRRSRA